MSRGEHNLYLGFSPPQKANKGSKNLERLKKKLSEQESLLLLMSPNMAFRVHNRNGKVSLLWISKLVVCKAPGFLSEPTWVAHHTCPFPKAKGYLQERLELFPSSGKGCGLSLSSLEMLSPPPGSAALGLVTFSASACSRSGHRKGCLQQDAEAVFLSSRNWAPQEGFTFQQSLAWSS